MNTRRRNMLWIILWIVWFILLFLTLYTGHIKLPASGILQSFAYKLGYSSNENFIFSPEQEALLWYVRMPRFMLGMLVGSALALAGTVMQGVFSNPLADPGVIGTTSGATLGAVIATGLGLSSYNFFYIPAFAFLGALLSVMLTLLLAMRKRKGAVRQVLLAGLAVSMLMNALTSLVLIYLNEYRIKEFLFWMIGGLDFRSWQTVYLVIGPILLGSLTLVLLARHLNVIILGDVEAGTSGMRVKFYRFLFLSLASFVTAGAVCAAGSIGFVGLIVPHMARLLIGADHRQLLPFSAMAGAVFLLLCDFVGKNLFASVEIRVGIVTAVMGAPFFLYLLLRNRRIK